MKINIYQTSLLKVILFVLVIASLTSEASAQSSREIQENQVKEAYKKDNSVPDGFSNSKSPQKVNDKTYEVAFVIFEMDNYTKYAEFINTIKAVKGVTYIDYCKNENAYVLQLDKKKYVENLSPEMRKDFNNSPDAESVRFCNKIFGDISRLVADAFPKIADKSPEQISASCGKK